MPVRQALIGRKQLWVVALLFAFSAMSYFDRTIISIAGPEMLREFGLTATQMGTIYSAFILGYALLMIPGGELTDRVGARRTLFGMGMGSAIFTALLVFSGRAGLGALLGVVPAMFLLRFGMGVVTAPLYPACARMTGNWFTPVHHARIQGLIIAGSSLGAAVSPLLFTWMIFRFRWQASFLITGGVTALLALVWYFSVSDRPAIAPASAPRVADSAHSWRSLLANRNLMLLTFAYGALGYFQYIFFYWIYYYFGEIRHLGAAESAKWTTILFVVEGAMMPLGGWASDRLTRRFGPRTGRCYVPMTGLALSALFMYTGTIAGSTGAVVACLSLAFGFAACCEGPFWAAVTEIAGARVGAAGSILNTGAQIGGFFSPMLTPYIAARAGWSWGLYAGGLVAILALVAVYFVDMGPRERFKAASLDS